MPHPDNPFGPFKSDDHRLSAVKVTVYCRTIVIVLTLLVFPLAMWLAPENTLVASFLGGFANVIKSLRKL
ncbi:MAG: hypothetical protein J0M21_12880 [Xanthomonadales bacterium]|nr:hypothetical protein [Xanthomonadales bacterium]